MEAREVQAEEEAGGFSALKPKLKLNFKILNFKI